MDIETSFHQIQLSDQEKATWYKIQFQLKKFFGKKPDLNALLFLIGMQELGQAREFSKEEKMDLMHVGMSRLLTYPGYYSFDYTDADGWPHFKLLKNPPFNDLSKQEDFLKKLIVRYFEENNLLEA